jgi:hypothetical protein
MKMKEDYLLRRESVVGQSPEKDLLQAWRVHLPDMRDRERDRLC